jgi:hypothetical protein
VVPDGPPRAPEIFSKDYELLILKKCCLEANRSVVSYKNSQSRNINFEVGTLFKSFISFSGSE